MKIKLLLKQSFRDFTKRIFFYLTFTLFLILAISVSLGMISFSYGFKNSFDETLGDQRVNASIVTEERFLPAWVNKNEELETENYSAQEKLEKNQKGYLFLFLTSLLEKEKNQNWFWSANEDELNKILLTIGYHAGYVFEVSEKDVLEDPLLNKYLKDVDLNEFNQHLVEIRKILNQEYQTNNLGSAYFIDQILGPRNSEFYLGETKIKHDYSIEMVDQLEQSVFWEFLKTDESMGALHDSTPITLHTNPTNVQKIWNQVDFNRSEYHDYFQEQKIVYVQPYFLSTFHYQLGDIIRLRFTQWDYLTYPARSLDLLISGTATSSNTLGLNERLVNPGAGNSPTFCLPYELVSNEFDFWNEKNGQDPIEKLANRPVVFNDHIFFNVKSLNNNLTAGLEFADAWLNSIFSNLKNPDQELRINRNWTRFHPAYSYEFSQTLFLIIAYMVGLVVLGLLFAVFYFITQQVIFLQRQTLFFLKGIGVSNTQLSLLTTAAMFVPLLLGISFGIFGSLAIQLMMNQIAFADIGFYLPYFSFNWIYLTAGLGILLFSILIFYLINTFLIKSKRLTLEGMTTLKNNVFLFEKIKKIIPQNTPKFHIGLSFIFKNIYKNVISFLILTITFSIVLYTVEFNSSVLNSAQAYEKWNQPYKSVNYAQELKLFSPAETENKFSSEEYVREYDQISNLDGLKPITKIDWENDLDNPQNFIYVIKEYFKSIALEPKSSTFTNWKDYYLEKNFVKEEMNKIVDNPESRTEFIQKLTKFLKYPPISTDEKTIKNIVDLIGRIVEKYRQIRQVYHYDEGLTILMGHVFAPNENRSLFAASATYFQKKPLRILAFEKDDWETQKYFDFANLSDDDFLVETPTGEKLLKVNISAYLQSLENLKHGDRIELEISGLRSTQNPSSAKVLVYVDKIVTHDTVSSSIFTSQTGLIEYLTESFQEIDNKLPFGKNFQMEVYKKLLAELMDKKTTLSNSVFDKNSSLPIGIRYLTVPLFHHIDATKPVGSRIEDFYDQNEIIKYWDEFATQAMIFKLVTIETLKAVSSINDTLQNFVWILVIISLLISMILVVLILAENREVILQFKALGYQKREINWYLTSGYFIAALFATSLGIVFAFLALNISRQPLAKFLLTTISFVWSWKFIVFAFLLPLLFCFLVSTSFLIYTNLQKPKNAFITF